LEVVYKIMNVTKKDAEWKECVKMIKDMKFFATLKGYVRATKINKKFIEYIAPMTMRVNLQ
jgi:hypothetical protein